MQESTYNKLKHSRYRDYAGEGLKIWKELNVKVVS